MPEMVMARPGAMIPRGIMTRMTNIPIQVYGINLLVRLLAEGPADVRVHCPKGSPIRYGEVVARGDGFDEGANAFREMPDLKAVVAFEESAEEVERSEEHTSELQSLAYLVCRLLLEKKKNKNEHPPDDSR